MTTNGDGDLTAGIDPGASPRQPFTSEAKRERPIFRESSAEFDWLVEITPISGMTSGRALTLDTDRRGRGDVTFEIRAEWWGQTRPEFEATRHRKARRIVEHYVVDVELAERIARAAADQLRNGERDLFLPQIEREAREQ